MAVDLDAVILENNQIAVSKDVVILEEDQIAISRDLFATDELFTSNVDLSDLKLVNKDSVILESNQKAVDYMGRPLILNCQIKNYSLTGGHWGSVG